MDEAQTFAEDEFVVAFSIVANDLEARRWAREMKEPRDLGDTGPPWQLAPDVLNVLSLVTLDCAHRVAKILRLTADEARARRVQAGLQFGRSVDFQKSTPTAILAAKPPTWQTS